MHDPQFSDAATPDAKVGRVHSAAILGVAAIPIDVEVVITRGNPSFKVTGMPEASARETSIRAQSGLKRIGVELYGMAITARLIPGDIRTGFTAFDLPVAVGVLAALGRVGEAQLQHHLVVGELSLGGEVRAIRGVLPLTAAAREAHFDGVLVPRANAREAALVDGVKVYAVTHLEDIVGHLAGGDPLIPEASTSSTPPLGEGSVPDFSDVQGLDAAVRGMEVAAAGGHHVMLVGHDGAGASLLAARLPGILPPMTLAERLETSTNYSVMGLLRETHPLLSDRPFRAPHHTISDAGLVGGGVIPRPGEVSLAHRGVLFLHELPEFRRNVLEALCEPLEQGRVALARGQERATYPARMQVVVAMLPCPCGYLGHSLHSCSCTREAIARYRARVPRQLADRMDIHLQLPERRGRPSPDGRPAEASRTIAQRGVAARALQSERFGDADVCNATMDVRQLRSACPLTAEANAHLDAAIVGQDLSARDVDRLFRVATTVADLAGVGQIDVHHLTEALGYGAKAR